MLHGLPIRILHAARYPGKVPITLHRHLPTHVRQSVFAGVSGLGLEIPPKSLPVLPKLLPKRPDFLNWYSPALGIKQVFFDTSVTALIRSVIPQTRVNVTLPK